MTPDVCGASWKKFGLSVINGGGAFGQYERFQRICQIDFFHIPIEWSSKSAPGNAARYEWYTACYAVVIVHEATHGHLDSLGFDYTKKTCAHIERICKAEERRFAARLTSDHYDFANDLVASYDPANWEEAWNETRWQSWRKMLKIAREIWNA